MDVRALIERARRSEGKNLNGIYVWENWKATVTPTTSGRHASDHSDNRHNRSARTQFDIEIGAGTNIDSLLVLWLKKKSPWNWCSIRISFTKFWLTFELRSPLFEMRPRWDANLFRRVGLLTLSKLLQKLIYLVKFVRRLCQICEEASVQWIHSHGGFVPRIMTLV